MRKKLFLVMKNIVLTTLIYILINYFTLDGELAFNYNDFFNEGLVSIFFKNLEGIRVFDFMKLIIVLSIYFLSDIGTINHFSNYSEGYKNIVKYHSTSRGELVRNICKTNISEILKNTFFWIFVFLIPIALLNNFEIIKILDYFNILQFIGLNIIYLFVVVIVSSNSITTIVLFVMKHFIFSVFNNAKLILFLLLFIIVVLYIKFGDKLGEDI